MRRDLGGEKECDGRFHVAVAATLVLLAMAMVDRVEEERRKEKWRQHLESRICNASKGLVPSCSARGISYLVHKIKARAAI